MHRFRWLSLLGVTCTFGLGIAACGDDGGGVPQPPDAAAGPDAPDTPDIDAAPGDIDAAPPVGIDAGDGPDAGPQPDATPPVLGGVVISEVVLVPQQDWGKTGGVGLPFDGIAGNDTVSSRDQYIEIHNAGSTPVSLSGWSIAVIDSSDGEETVTPLANDTEDGVVLSLGGGSVGNILDPGDYAVLGNPIGTIASDAYILLRDNRSVVVDEVEIGVDDFADDGDDGAPGGSQNGYSLGQFDEAVARPAGQADTNNDPNDFEKMYATPLGPNVPLPVPANDTTAPRASAPPSANNWRVTDPVRVVFNERLRAASLSPADLELRVNGVVRPIERLSYAQQTNDAVIQAETLGVLPFNATVTLTARASIIDYAGNALGTDAVFTFTTEAAPPNNPAVLINEVCTDPQQDWNHSSDNGTPFTNTPGPNPASRSSSDEWIELIVSTGSSVNLTGYTLEVFNGPNIEALPLQVTTLDDAKVTAREIQFSSGNLASVPAGARVVVGNPTGSMENDIYLVLRDNNKNIVDEVEIGGINLATDRGGDGTGAAGAGAPDVGINGNASGPADETIARLNSGGPTDTGNDAGDWTQGAASILQPN